MNCICNWIVLWALATSGLVAADLEKNFQHPPPENRPWVYWYFMDGNLSREGITADLEAMHDAGIGGAIFLEVDRGLPRGPVKFMSPEWQQLFVHAVRESKRLGIDLAVAAGPGWCGTGGPWVKPEQSMQDLVASETKVTGPVKFDAVLARPLPRSPFFGEGTLTPELKKEWQQFYRDVTVPFAKPQRHLYDASPLGVDAERNLEFEFVRATENHINALTTLAALWRMVQVFTNTVVVTNTVPVVTERTNIVFVTNAVSGGLSHQHVRAWNRQHCDLGARRPASRLPAGAEPESKRGACPGGGFGL